MAPSDRSEQASGGPINGQDALTLISSPYDSASPLAVETNRSVCSGPRVNVLCPPLESPEFRELAIQTYTQHIAPGDRRSPHFEKWRAESVAETRCMQKDGGLGDGQHATDTPGPHADKEAISRGMSGSNAKTEPNVGPKSTKSLGFGGNGSTICGAGSSAGGVDDKGSGGGAHPRPGARIHATDQDVNDLGACASVDYELTPGALDAVHDGAFGGKGSLAIRSACGSASDGDGKRGDGSACQHPGQCADAASCCANTRLPVVSVSATVDTFRALDAVHGGTFGGENSPASDHACGSASDARNERGSGGARGHPGEVLTTAGCCARGPRRVLSSVDKSAFRALDAAHDRASHDNKIVENTRTTTAP